MPILPACFTAQAGPSAARAAGEGCAHKGIEQPWAIDATAGFGEDSLLLAATGFTVDLYEQDCVIAALLKDALDRAADDPALAAAVARMRLHAGEDSIAGLRHTAELVERGELAAPDVVYLDPMFPERTKSAAVKKKFQLLHHLEQPCADEETLVEAALASCPRKVVIKRPVKGRCLPALSRAISLRARPFATMFWCRRARSLRAMVGAPSVPCRCGVYFHGCDVRCQPPQYSHL